MVEDQSEVNRLTELRKKNAITLNSTQRRGLPLSLQWPGHSLAQLSMLWFNDLPSRFSSKPSDYAAQLVGQPTCFYVTNVDVSGNALTVSYPFKSLHELDCAMQVFHH